MSLSRSTVWVWMYCFLFPLCVPVCCGFEAYFPYVNFDFGS